MYRPPGINFAPVEFLGQADADKKIAYRSYRHPAARYGLVYFEGLMSTMEGLKSMALEVESQMRLKCNCVRFDYEGQGVSTGSLDGTSVCSWIMDGLNIVDNVCEAEPQILVGSSIGAWVALQVALQRRQRVKALVLIAPAVDITELWWQRMREEDRQHALSTKRVPVPGNYLQGQILPISFLVNSRPSLLLSGGPRSIAVNCPVRIFHGMRDSAAPPSISRELIDKLETEDVHVTLVKDGDHRLSRPQDLSAILGAVQEMMEY